MLCWVARLPARLTQLRQALARQLRALMRPLQLSQGQASELCQVAEMRLLPGGRTLLKLHHCMECLILSEHSGPLCNSKCR